MSTIALVPDIDLHTSKNGRQALPIVPQNVDDQLSQYALQLLRMRPADHPVDDVLHEMEILAEQENIPIIGPLEGAIIQMLVHMRSTPATYVLDIGTAIGYSAIWLGRSLPAQSKVISIEIDSNRAELARDFIYQAGLSSQIEVLVGDVFELLPQLDTQFDIILQDVIKHIYFGASSQLSLQLLDLCIERLVDGGLLLGDNVFCMGEVLHENTGQIPKQVIGIQDYNTRVSSHPLLDSIVLPVRDGLWISQKRPVG